MTVSHFISSNRKTRLIVNKNMKPSVKVMERRIKIQDTMILTMKLIVSGEIHINIYLNNLTRD